MSVNHKVFSYTVFSRHHSFIITFGFLTHLKLILKGLELVSILNTYLLLYPYLLKTFSVSGLL